MDDRHFDALARLLAMPSPRRRLLSVVGALAAGWLIPGSDADLDAVVAAKRCRGKDCRRPRPCRRGRCRCRGGAKRCAGVCTDLKRDLAHCGACGRACRGAVNCVDGECVCPSGRELCGDDCVEIQDDRDHCGTCNEVCTGGEDCRQGGCCTPGYRESESEEALCCPRVDVCGAATCCPPGDMCKNGSCCGPVGFAVCDGGAGECCPTSSEAQCCGTTCCEAPVQCCGENCCRSGNVCCPDDPNRCCTEEALCPSGMCDCYEQNMRVGEICYVRAGSGGGRFVRARGFLR